METPPAAAQVTCDPVTAVSSTIVAARVPAFSRLAATCTAERQRSEVVSVGGKAVAHGVCGAPSNLRSDAERAVEYLGGLCCGFADDSGEWGDDAGLACGVVAVHRHEGLVVTCQVSAAVAQCREAVAQGRAPWAAVVVHGFADDPTAWGGERADFADGRLAGRLAQCGENVVMVLVLPGGGACAFACAAAGSAFRRFW